MRIYKELEALGFFEWYCTQYGGLNYTEYNEVYDQLPLDNLIITKLNACVLKFFRDVYELDSRIISDRQFDGVDYSYLIPNEKHEDIFCDTHEEAELQCIKKLIQINKI